MALTDETLARLNAAAPELYEASKSAVRWLAKGIADGTFDGCVNPAAAVADLARLEAVLAKVTAA